MRASLLAFRSVARACVLCGLAWARSTYKQGLAGSCFICLKRFFKNFDLLVKAAESARAFFV